MHSNKKKNGVNLDKIDFNNPEFVEKVAKNILQKMEENPGMTLKDAIGISHSALEQIYSLAYQFYYQGKYAEALSLFEFLAGTSPDNYKYVLGLAASYHQIKAYDEAFAGFYIALHLEPHNPIPAYYATDCFLKQNLNEEALELAELTAEICDNRPEYAKLKQRCKMIAKTLKEKNNLK
jgi:type III secretion system low calcium response chaperone LcrH/SycD